MFGPLIVTELAFCERVILLPPARYIVPVEIFAKAPAVLPDKDAAIPPPAPGITDAVIVPALSPKLTLLALAKVTADKLAEVEPAEKLTDTAPPPVPAAPTLSSFLVNGLIS